MPENTMIEPVGAAGNGGIHGNSRYTGMADLVRAAGSPLGIVALALILLEAAGMTQILAEDDHEALVLAGMAVGFVLVLGIFVWILARTKTPVSSEPRQNPPDVTRLDRPDEQSSEENALALSQKDKVWPPVHVPPSVDSWRSVLVPLSSQALHYTTPTYFLDLDLNVIGWNAAFEIIFKQILEDIRDRHVNFFIARMKNKDEVFNRARDFTEEVREKQILPLVHTEYLTYASPAYGDMVFLKVAVLLHDEHGVQKAWSVGLIPREIDWDRIKGEISKQLEMDKLWSVYSASYDRVLLPFAPYRSLQKDVVSVVQKPDSLVLDAGAGTGNATQLLLEAGHRVVALENNLGMLARFEAKRFDPNRCTLKRSSVEGIRALKDSAFDAVIMTNVIYSVEDPLGCLREIHRVLKPGGVLGLSTTHSETELTPLLEAIKRDLKEQGLYDRLETDYINLKNANRTLEETIVRRHSRDDYRAWIRNVGFEITRDEPSRYHDAVMLIHAARVE